jgi:hypothetical protein
MVQLPRAAGDAGPDADRATDFHAGFGALDFDEAGPVSRAGIPGMGSLPRQVLGWMFRRLGSARGLSQHGRNRQHRNKDRKRDISHSRFYPARPGYASGRTRCFVRNLDGGDCWRPWLRGPCQMGPKSGFPAPCSLAQTPLYVRARAPGDNYPGSARHYRCLNGHRFAGMRNGNAANSRSQRDSVFRSLRLSVRTPPFHGGESGSIPLGSAKKHLAILIVSSS